MKLTTSQNHRLTNPPLTRTAKRGLQMLRELRCALLLGSTPLPPPQQIEFQF